MISAKSAVIWIHSVVKLKSIALGALMFAAGFAVSAKFRIAPKANDNGTGEYFSKPSGPEPAGSCPYCEPRPTERRYCETDKEFEQACGYGRWKAFQRAGQ